MEACRPADQERFSRQAIALEGAKRASEFHGRRRRRFELLPATPGPVPLGAKKLHFIRHGEGLHNVWRNAEFDAGRTPRAKRDNIEQVPAELHDPLLTACGRGEAEAAKDKVRTLGCKPELLVTSPLRRSVQTLLLAFEDAVKAGTTCLAHELAREEVRGGDGDPSIWDSRKPRETLASEFPEVDFRTYVLPPDEGEEGEEGNTVAAGAALLRGDPLWWRRASPFGSSGEGEDEAAMAERAWHFLCWLMSRPEREIAVASHSIFLLSLFHGALNPLQGQRTYAGPQLLHTGELRSVLVREFPEPQKPRDDKAVIAWGLALAGRGLGVEMAQSRWRCALAACPFVAILRGIEASHAVMIGHALVEAGFRIVEVPLNSPDALTSISLLRGSLDPGVVIGAGTVLKPEEVDAVAKAGGALVVSPNANEAVVRRTKALGLLSLPGVCTPTEAFLALDWGADGLKAFPGEHLPPKILKAWRAVLPPGTCLVPTGGITAENMAEYWEAGACGFGIGTAVFKPGDDPERVRQKAAALVAAGRGLRRGVAHQADKRRKLG